VVYPRYQLGLGDAAAQIDPIARRVFWRRLDRLVVGVRR
jgi:hypothetical protein